MLRASECIIGAVIENADLINTAACGVLRILFIVCSPAFGGGIPT